MTVYARGIDYAWSHPDPASIAAGGYVFACRYLSRDPSKNLTRAEADVLAAHGIWVVANWEYGAQDMLRGYAGGVADAQLAHQQATDAGMPPGRPIYFSADWDVTPAQEPTVLAYLSGADSVLGWSDVGEYGGYYPLKTALDAGATIWAWQSLAWSGGQWDTRATIRQTGTATVGGVQVDVNEAMVDDFGQWMPGRLPEGVADMEQTDTVVGSMSRGNKVGDVLADMSNWRDQWYLPPGSNSNNPPPAGSRLDLLFGQITDIQAKVTNLAAGLDPKTLAASLAAAVGPTITQAVIDGITPSADQLAQVFEQHLAAALAAAK